MAQSVISAPPELFNDQPGETRTLSFDKNVTGDVGQNIIVFYTRLDFQQPLAAGEGTVQSCDEVKCQVEILLSRAFKLFPPQKDSEVTFYSVLPRPKVVQNIEQGKVPKGPTGKSPTDSNLFKIALGFRVGSFNYTESAAGQGFDQSKFLRERSPLLSGDFYFQWWMLYINASYSKAGLPTKTTFGDFIKSSIMYQSYGVGLEFPIIKKKLFVTAGADLKKTVFVTDNDNEAIVSSTTTEFGPVASIAWEFDGNIFGDPERFAFNGGRATFGFKVVANGKANDTGENKRGTSGDLTNVELSLRYRVVSQGPSIISRGWMIEAFAIFDAYGFLKFSGPVNPASYPEGIESNPKHSELGFIVGKQYEF